jgi:hypothetical protein
MKKSMKAAKKTSSKIKEKKSKDSSVLDTAGGEMPDPTDRQGPSQKDVRYAFHRK